ncbi:RHS repeat-associated core domain-containing protein [Pseudomonas cremoricolorata]|uniref:RHS repeat-associated core domain-containing protein n=1 Tax=Pseudomonas cremoricolorata TaxID=157783 RepID=UPI0009DB7CA7|nr:RHS repeat-associated core domain-containing protein [Pseudomonas cremoricolorata]
MKQSFLQSEQAGRRLGLNAFVRRGYTPFGFLSSDLASSVVAYAGQPLNGVASGYLLGNGHRLYKPSLMRFVSADVLSPFGDGGLNTYVYCANDPVNQVDPSGKAPTGLTALLKKFGLPKNDLKFLLKPLSRKGWKGEVLLVSKLHGETLTTYKFTGDHPRIMGEQLVWQEHRDTIAGEFFVKGNIYIKADSKRTRGTILISNGYERRSLSSETHAFIAPTDDDAGTASTDRRAISHRGGLHPEDYARDIRLGRRGNS